jgi:hypothetical protein
MTEWTKPANFAGVFYPGNKRGLETAIREFGELAETGLPDSRGEVVGIVSPHAGYVYSGAISARSFQFARDRRPETVIAIGLSHRVRLRGVSLLDAEVCETPLGPLWCDREFQKQLSLKLPFAETDREAHLSEHSVETQLPFIRFHFPDAKVVEILTQDPSPPLSQRLGEAIAETARELGRSILIVASTDLSHYPTSELAEEIDAASLESLALMDPFESGGRFAEIEERGLPEVHCAVCSKAAVFAGMSAASNLGANQGIILGYANSGHVKGGDRGRVVGYGSVAWVQSAPQT